jgi:hypothetical protein
MVGLGVFFVLGSLFIAAVSRRAWLSEPAVE